MGDFLDDLNNLSKSAKAEDISNFRPHPFGEFNGEVVEVKKKTTDNGTPLWEIGVKTDAGTAHYTIWGYTADDIAKAKSDDAHKVRIVNGIARTKRLFVDCGLTEPADWNGILAALGDLRGAKCRVNVQPSTKDPSKRFTFINAWVDGADDKVAKAVVSGSPSSSTTPDLDSIPF